MDGQRDQDVSPGYPGPDGLNQEDAGSNRDHGVVDTIEQAAHDLIHGRSVEIDENEPELADDPGQGFHERQDIGLATADVENTPYDGSADTPALDATRVPSQVGNDTITESSE